MANRLTLAVLLVLPGALTAYLSFNSGGFFPDTQAFVVIVLVLILAARIALANAPFAGFGRPLLLVGAGLGLFALWTLLSGLWSDAPGRALLEFDRVLVYLVGTLLFGSFVRSAARVRWMLRGLALAIFAVCTSGLVTRLLPDLWPISGTIADNRLSYPLTYWNSLGLIAAVGIVLCFHFTSSRSEPPAARVLGAAAVPPLAATVALTFSRGAIAAGIAGLLTYALVARPRALISGLAATVPAAAIAIVAAYNADLLATLDPTRPAAVDQGHRVAIVVCLCAAGAGLLRAVLLRIDARLPLRLSRRVPRRTLVPAVAGSIVALAALLTAVGLPGEVERQYDRFVEGENPGTTADLRTRLIDPANNGRLDHWDVALEGFRNAPVEGSGAGTYENLWAIGRPTALSVRDAHSLYVETLGELGIVGFALLAIALATVIVMLALCSRGRDRTLYAALLGAAVTWLLAAAVDWNWEMPAVTLWLFCLAGAALAESGGRRQLIGPPSAAARTLATAACAALAIAPSLVLISQGKLDDSADAFAAGDCPAAVKDARSSISALAVRAEPYEIRGYCRLQDGQPDSAVRDFEKAIDRDPDNWTYHYDVAIARGAASLDPRSQAAQALRLNPRNVQAQDAVKRFQTDDPRRWLRESRALLRGASPFYLSRR